VQATAQPDTPRANEHFLRDSIPAANAAIDPPDTTDEGFTLPEEKSKKQLAKEIAVWVITAAFVAYFIVKVFIEKDNSSSPPPPSGKPITPPK
jgi:hypothetical protein